MIDQDFRLKLKAHFAAKKSQNRAWTYSAWAKKLGLKSASSITKILDGSRVPSPELTSVLVKDLGLSGREEDLFRKSVLVSKSNTADAKALIFSSSQKDAEMSVKSKLLGGFEFDLIGDWHHLAIRELLKAPANGLTIKQLQKILKGRVNPGHITKSIEILLLLKLIQKTKQGFEATDAVVQTESDKKNLSIQKYHQQMLQNAQRALEEAPVESREFVGVTFMLSRSKLKEAKALVRQFAEKIEGLVQGESPDQLYQFQAQLFALSDPVTGKKQK